MDETMHRHTFSPLPFNEAEWLRLVFLLSDTAAWIKDMEKAMLYQVPLPDKHKLLRKTFYLSATALAHIMEKHYYKISRHPACSKFTVPVTDIVHWIKQASYAEPVPERCTMNFVRWIDTYTITGFTRAGEATTFITVITEPSGAVKTAFPGSIG